MTVVQPAQKGGIGITLVSYWMIPNTHTKPDIDAAGRALDFMLGWLVMKSQLFQYNPMIN